METPVKSKQGDVLRSKERKMVEKVYDYIARKNPGKSVNWFVKECAEATRVSVPTIYKIRSEASRGPLVSPVVVLLCAIKLSRYCTSC